MTRTGSSMTKAPSRTAKAAGIVRYKGEFVRANAIHVKNPPEDRSSGGSSSIKTVYLLPCTHLYSETCTFFDSHSSLFFFRLFPLFSGSRTPLILSLFLHFTVPDAFNFLLLLFFFLPCRQELISCSDSFSDAVFFLPTNEKCGEWK